MRDELEDMGCSVFPASLSPKEFVTARAAAEAVQAHAGAAKAGVRDALGKHDMFRAIAESPTVSSLAQAILGSTAFVTRAILSNKTPGANWDVAWHQDVTIAVRAKADVKGFGPWSVKYGVPHVQPPASVLERMVTVRIHLDDCNADNGPPAGRAGIAPT